MLVKSDMKNMVNGQGVETIAFVKSYAHRVAKNGNRFIDGMLEIKGSVPFQVWSDVVISELEKYSYDNMVCFIAGNIDEYNGKKRIIITNIKALQEGQYNIDDFFECKYNIDMYWSALEKLVVKNCSSEGVEIFNTVIEDIKDRFKVEFAARGHHDAVRGGLLAHTYKVTYILTKVIKLYPRICKVVDNDLFALGCAIHDIGKVYEYTNGVIIGNGLIASHNIFGVEMLSKYKDFIVSKKSEEFYYRLLSIVTQHHGEYGEKPRSVEAYLVHLADFMESSIQAIEEGYEQGLDTVTTNNFKLH